MRELEDSLQTRQRDLEESDELSRQLRQELEQTSECLLCVAVRVGVEGGG